MRFEFATAGRIVFGAGVVREASKAAAGYGRRALLVTGAHPERAAKLVSGIEAVPFAVNGEPTVDLIRHGATVAREERCDVVIAIGGGSAIDAGKTIAALATNPGDALEYLEVIGQGKPLERDPAPFIAVPTTAGTGSEVTRNAVLGSLEHRVKVSLRSARMLPRMAVIDPELARGLPPAVTAYTGLDALTQLIEPYVSVRANAMTDLFCVEGMQTAVWALPRAFQQGSDLEARTGMAWAALLGGLALANAGLGAVHGFAAPVGGMFPAPHGAICAALLPHAMAVNIAALHSQDGKGQALQRYKRVASLLTGAPHATPEDGVRWVADLCRKLEIPPLGRYGVREVDIPALVGKAARANSMKGNPIALNETELAEIVTCAL
ncbi:MAG: iron-containing alcohol dehydrogenase [Acidobacteriia bacterium]|nr:iron-containing alcohol dehydrogenase [Terriglobia bacterium]